MTIIPFATVLVAACSGTVREARPDALDRLLRQRASTMTPLEGSSDRRDSLPVVLQGSGASGLRPVALARVERVLAARGFELSERASDAGAARTLALSIDDRGGKVAVSLSVTSGGATRTDDVVVDRAVAADEIAAHALRILLAPDASAIAAAADTSRVFFVVSDERSRVNAATIDAWRRVLERRGLRVIGVDEAHAPGAREGAEAARRALGAAAAPVGVLVVVSPREQGSLYVRITRVTAAGPATRGWFGRIPRAEAEVRVGQALEEVLAEGAP